MYQLVYLGPLDHRGSTSGEFVLAHFGLITGHNDHLFYILNEKRSENAKKVVESVQKMVCKASLYWPKYTTADNVVVVRWHQFLK